MEMWGERWEKISISLALLAMALLITIFSIFIWVIFTKGLMEITSLLPLVSLITALASSILTIARLSKPYILPADISKVLPGFILACALCAVYLAVFSPFSQSLTAFLIMVLVAIGGGLMHLGEGLKAETGDRITALRERISDLMLEAESAFESGQFNTAVNKYKIARSMQESLIRSSLVPDEEKALLKAKASYCYFMELLAKLKIKTHGLFELLPNSSKTLERLTKSALDALIIAEKIITILSVISKAVAPEITEEAKNLMKKLEEKAEIFNDLREKIITAFSYQKEKVLGKKHFIQTRSTVGESVLRT